MNAWRAVARMMQGEYKIAHHPDASAAPEVVASMMMAAAADGFEATGDPTFDREEFCRIVRGEGQGKVVRK